MKYFALILSLAACAEVQEGSPHVSRPQAAAPAATPKKPEPKPSAPPQPSSPEPSGPSNDTSTLSPARLTLNEVSGDADWVELYNAGESEATLSGLALAPKKNDADAPDLAEAVRFGEGETLAGHAFVIIACKKATASGVLASDCLSAGPETCYAATFGISDKDGETLFLVGSDDAVLERVDYPAATVPKEQSWARASDGGEAFAVSPAPTPAVSNVAP